MKFTHLLFRILPERGGVPSFYLFTFKVDFLALQVRKGKKETPIRCSLQAAVAENTNEKSGTNTF